MALVALSFMAFTHRVAHAGSAYAYIAHTFGSRMGFVAGWTLLLTYLGFATGFAALQLGRCGGTNAPVSHLGTGGLLVGTYTVSVTNEAGASAIGTFDVRQLMIMTMVPVGKDSTEYSRA